VQQGLAFQIKELRISRGLTQAQLAKALGVKSQSAVARLESPGYGRLTVSTLLKIAALFDIAFVTKFVPYSRFLCEVEDVSPRALSVLSFESEDAVGLIENAPEFKMLPSTSKSHFGAVFICRYDQRPNVLQECESVPRIEFQGTTNFVKNVLDVNFEEIAYVAQN
jgi:transcriptional regulator with XRE-family HTH domain